jgi:hypothetical protein
MFAYMQSLGTAQGHAPPPPLFLAADPAEFTTPVSIKILVLHYIFICSHTYNLFSVQGQSARRTTLTLRPALRRTSPDAHLVDDLFCDDPDLYL